MQGSEKVKVIKREEEIEKKMDRDGNNERKRVLGRVGERDRNRKKERNLKEKRK